MMHDYWHQNWWFAKTFKAGTRALAAADEGTKNRLSPPPSAAASETDPLGAEATASDGPTILSLTSREVLPSLTASAPSGNGDPSGRANGLADRRGSAPGLEAPTDTPEPSSAPLDFDEEMQRRSHPPQSSATASDEGSMT